MPVFQGFMNIDDRNLKILLDKREGSVLDYVSRRNNLPNNAKQRKKEMTMTKYTIKQFASKYSLTDLDSRAVLGYLTSMGAIKIVGGVEKEPGQKGRKERIFEVPAQITLEMTNTRDFGLLKIPEAPEVPVAPKVKAEKPPKVAKVKAPKAPKVKKAKTAETPAVEAVATETPAETPAETVVAETPTETPTETVETAELEAVTS